MLLFKWPRSSLALISRRLLSSVKLEEFQDCRSYLISVIQQCQDQKSKVQWTQISANLVNTLRMDEQSRRQVKPQTLDFFVLGVLSSLDDHGQVANYFRYLSDQGKSWRLPLPAMIHALKCWSKSVLNECDKDLVKDVVQDMLERQDLSDQAKHLMCAVLANAGDLDQGMNMWQSLFQTSQNDITNLMNLMKAAIAQDRLDVFWELCENEQFLLCSIGSQVRSPNRIRSEEVFAEFIEKYHEDTEQMEKLFSYFRDKIYFLSLHLIYVIQKFKKAVVTTKSNRCKNCGETIPEHTVTKEDCHAIADAIENMALAEDKVFKFSDPKEVERFRGFLDKASKKNINCVIDGLNAGIGGHIKHGRLDGRQGQVEHVVKALQWLKSFGFNILILHRHWFKKRPEYRDVFNNVSAIHLVNKLSDDDIFSLLAALRFGPNTILCTNDLHRQYYDKLPTPRLQRLFVHWQLHHKSKIWFAESFRKKDNISFTVSSIFSRKLQSHKNILTKIFTKISKFI